MQTIRIFYPVGSEYATYAIMYYKHMTILLNYSEVKISGVPYRIVASVSWYISYRDFFFCFNLFWTVIDP